MHVFFHKEHWRAAYISLRRFHRDPAAKRHFTGFAGLFVLFAGCLAADTAILLSRADATARWIVFTLIFSILAVACVRSLYLSWDTGRIERNAAPLITEDVRTALAGQVFTLALLIQRAGSEECLAEKELPSEIEVTTRADGLARLEQLGLYPSLLPHMRELFLLPDGHWTEEQRARIFTCWEDFEAIRWAMSLSQTLVSIEDAPKHGWRDTLRIARSTEAALRSAKLRPAWDIRLKRDQAKRYLDRCVSRMVTAGMIDAVPENADWQRKMEEIYDLETRADLLVGHEYIREVDAPTLIWTAHRAARRYDVLAILTDIASGEARWYELKENLEAKLSPVVDSELV